MQRILLAIVLLAPSVALAQVTPKTRSLELGTVLNNIDLDGAAAVRTFTIGPSIGGTSLITGDERLEGYTWLDLRFAFTYGASTDVGLTCTTSENGGTDEDTLQDCTLASGVCTSNDASWTKAVTASKKWRWRIGIKNGKRVKCVVTSTGAGASDQLTVKAKVVAP